MQGENAEEIQLYFPPIFQRMGKPHFGKAEVRLIGPSPRSGEGLSPNNVPDHLGGPLSFMPSFYGVWMASHQQRGTAASAVSCLFSCAADKIRKRIAFCACAKTLCGRIVTSMTRVRL